MGERVVVVKYELFAENSDERVGKSDRVEVPLDQDPEMATISFRDAVHERRRVRDLAHCSSANLRLFLSSDPDQELEDDDFLQFLLDGAPERVRVVAPAPFRMLVRASPLSSWLSYLFSTLCSPHRAQHLDSALPEGSPCDCG